MVKKKIYTNQFSFQPGIFQLFFLDPGFGLYEFWNARICNKKSFFCHHDNDFLLLPPPLLPTIKPCSDPARALKTSEIGRKWPLRGQHGSGTDPGHIIWVTIPKIPKIQIKSSFSRVVLLCKTFVYHRYIYRERERAEHIYKYIYCRFVRFTSRRVQIRGLKKTGEKSRVES